MRTLPFAFPRMTNIKLVIFDLDGTLVDAYPAIIETFNFTMRRFGLPEQTALAIRRAVGSGDRKLLEPFIAPGDLDEALSVYRRYHRTALLNGSRLMPGALSLLRFLKRNGYKIAVASNRPTRFSLIIVRHLGLDKYLSAVLCGDRAGKMKPDPEILLRLMKRFHAVKEETLYVGDMAIDARTGRLAGVKTVMVTTGSSYASELKKEKPYRIFGNLFEVKRLFA